MHVLTSYRDLVDILFSSSWPHLEKVLKPLISSLIGQYVPALTHVFDLIDQSLLRGPTGDELTIIRQLLLSPNLSSELLGHGCSTLVSLVVGKSECGPLQDLLSELYQRHPTEVRNAIKVHTEENEEDDEDEYNLIASLSLVSWPLNFRCIHLTILLSPSFLLAIQSRTLSLCLRITNQLFVLKVCEGYSRLCL